MKRTFGCFFGIIAFVLAVSIFDGVFMSTFAKEMNEHLDGIEGAATIEEMAERSDELAAYYEKREFWLHRLVPTARLEEIEVSFSKLDAFLGVENYDECLAIAAEIRARVDRLYSTGFYHWYQTLVNRIG